MSYVQGFFLQIIAYALIWFVNPYIGFLITIITPVILAAIYLFAFIAEKIEPSKVPRSYFTWMLVSIFPAIIVLAFFVVINQGDLYWLN